MNDPSRILPSTVSSRSPPVNSKDPPAPPEQSPNPHIIHSSPIQGFIAEIDRKVEKIEGQLSQVYHIRDRPIWTEENDLRFIDLQSASRRNTPSIARLRRGLSQRSLVIESDTWEQATYRTSRVNRRTSRSALKPGRKIGFKNFLVAGNRIQHGIKLLICETLLSGAEISAILIFEYTQLRLIKFEDLEGLKNTIKDANRIKKFAHQKADWIDRCQKSYDGEWPCPWHSG